MMLELDCHSMLVLQERFNLDMQQLSTKVPDVKIVKRKERSSSRMNKLYANTTGASYVEEDVFVTIIRDDYIKGKGKYTSLNPGDKIKGVVSGVEADVTSVVEIKDTFTVDYYKQNLGWRVMLVRLVKIIGHSKIMTSLKLLSLIHKSHP